MPIPVTDQKLQQTSNATQDKQTQEPTHKSDQQTSHTSADNTSSTTITSSADLISRASQVSLDKNKGQSQSDPVDILDGSGFDRNQWNEMLQKLPEDQRQQLEAAYKSLQRGANDKFQKASERLKQAESLVKQPWTTDRINQLLTDPEFVQAAQAYTQAQAISQNPQSSGLSNEEWSALSENEKRQFHQVIQNQQHIQNQMTSMLLAQEDERLQERYKNYDPTQVKQLRTDLLKGNIQATSEHLWKVIDYDSAIQRAYELGRQDRAADFQEKQNASSVGVTGLNVTQANDVPVRQPNQSTVEHFKQIAMRNIQKLRQSQNRQ